MTLRPAELHVLIALGAGPQHGYALVGRIEEDSGGRLRMLPGNLYAVIRRLEATGLVAESRRRPAPGEDQRRRYYELTAKGRRTLEREASHLEDLAERARARLEPAVGHPKP